MANQTLCAPNGYGLPCRTVAGVSPYGIFLAPWVCPDNGTGPNSLVIVQNADMSIGTFSGGTASFKQYCQDNELASLVQTPDASNVVANGTFYSAVTTEFTLFQLSQKLLNELNIIGNGRWQAIIITNGQRVFFQGLNNPVNITTAAGGVNKTLGDLNGFTITLESHEQYGLTEITGPGGTSTFEEILTNVLGNLLVYNS